MQTLFSSLRKIGIEYDISDYTNLIPIARADVPPMSDIDMAVTRVDATMIAALASGETLKAGRLVAVDHACQFGGGFLKP
jgi:hypothetical protein